MSDTITRGIRVEVTTCYMPEKSSPDDDYFFFAYHVRISNLGETAAQLISREWIITDSNGSEHRVDGPGVVGEQPLLQPGSSFEYTSFCPLKTAVGAMHGCYRMVSANGDHFDAQIAPFSLEVPHSVN